MSITQSTTDIMTTHTLHTTHSIEWTMQVWRSAANAIATDSQAERRVAYEAAVAEMRASLADSATTAELAARFWSEPLMMVAARASVRRDGRVLNAQVIAAAACWEALARLVAASH